MVDHTQGPSLAEAVSSYLRSTRSPQADAQQQLAKFARWFGQDRPLSAIAPADLEDYAARASSGGNGADRLRPVRDFLSHARKTGILDQNLAVHLKARKTTRKAVAGRSPAATTASLTKEGYQQLQQRLESLQEELVQASAEIKRAAADKDFRENAPLEAARESHGKIAARIREIEDTLAHAMVIQSDGVPAAEVRHGSTVTLEEVATGGTITCILVDPREADMQHGKVSTSAPMGQAVLGRRVGDVVEVAAPRGSTRYRVIRVV